MFVGPGPKDASTQSLWVGLFLSRDDVLAPAYQIFHLTPEKKKAVLFERPLSRWFQIPPIYSAEIPRITTKESGP